MAKTNNLTDFLTDVADGIRAKKGTTAKINPQNFRSEIESISTGTDTSDATAVAGDILAGKTAYVASGKVAGTIETWDGSYEEISVTLNTVNIKARFADSSARIYYKLNDGAQTEIVDTKASVVDGKYQEVVALKDVSKLEIMTPANDISGYFIEGVGNESSDYVLLSSDKWVDVTSILTEGCTLVVFADD